MSNTEIAQPQFYSASFALTNGLLAAAPVANFNGTSEVLSIVRTVLSGTAPGIPKSIVAAPSAAGAVTGQWGLGVASNTSVVGADNSTYQVNWVNKNVTSTYLNPGILNGVTQTAAVGQYYAP